MAHPASQGQKFLCLGSFFTSPMYLFICLFFCILHCNLSLLYNKLVSMLVSMESASSSGKWLDTGRTQKEVDVYRPWPDISVTTSSCCSYRWSRTQWKGGGNWLGSGIFSGDSHQDMLRVELPGSIVALKSPLLLLKNPSKLRGSPSWIWKESTLPV